jgi:hypothetical protein
MPLTDTALGAPPVVPLIAGGQVGVELLEPDDVDPVVSLPISVCMAGAVDAAAVVACTVAVAVVVRSVTAAACAAAAVDSLEALSAASVVAASDTLSGIFGAADVEIGVLLATNETPPTT